MGILSLLFGTCLSSLERPPKVVDVANQFVGAPVDNFEIKSKLVGCVLKLCFSTSYVSLLGVIILSLCCFASPPVGEKEKR